MAHRGRALVICTWVIAVGIIFNWQFPQQLAAASIAFVQGNSGGYTAVTSLAVAFPSSNTAGNLIVVTARASAQNRTWTIGDTRGNAYILARQFNGSSDPASDLRVYYAYNIAGGSNTVSLSISGAAARLAATVREYSGFGTANPLGQSSAAEGSSSSLNSGSVTTTTSTALLVGFGTSSNQTTFSAGSGFGNLIENGIGRIASQDRIVGSIGTYASTMTISPSFGWGAMVVSFKGSGSGGGDTTPPVISGVQAANVSATTATISWITNEPSDSRVDFVSLCPTSGCSTPINPALTTSHAVSVSGLTANTTYTYNVKSKDASGNLSTSPNFSFTTGSTSTGGYPIKLSPSGTYLLDHDDRPTIINGDTAWSVIVQLTKQDAELYLTDRANKGYNLILVNLLEHWFSDNAPANLYGDQPFTTPGNFTTPNEAYFAHADWVINKAAEKGITVLLTPLYLGFNQNQGWQHEVQNNSLAAMRTYGRYVGNRYKNFPNIIWVIGGDTDPTPYSAKVLEFVAGIKDYDTTHLMTAHTVPEHGTVDYWPNQPWLNLNNIYTYVNSHPLALSEYNRTPFKPFFLLETYYEREHSSTPLMLRRQAYWSILSGGLLGHIFGNCPMWHFTTTTGNYFCTTAPWQGQLDSTGSTNLSYVGRLFQSREFEKLVPDQNHTVVTAGYQSGNTLATSARTSNGSTIISYIPTQRAVTVDMSKISGGGQAQAWWYNPRTNTASVVGMFATTGTQNFTPPDSNDWLLVIDSAALNLPAPGSGPIQPPPGGDTTPPTVSISAPANGATVSASISVTANAADNVGVVGVQFRLDGANLGSEDIVSPYTVTWNTTTSSNAPHTLTAVARDAAGNTRTSSSVSVTVNNGPPPDTTPPTVSVSSPAGGSTVSGALSVSANAADNVGVVGVQFKLDGANLGSEDVSSPHSVMWDTTTASNGTHALTAVARDAAGNVTTSTSVSVTVNNGAPADTTPPTVSVSGPAGGSTVSGSLSVTANAADNVGVVGVQFKLDGANLGSEDMASPYSVTWNTTTASNGPHTLTAVARDAAGNSRTSSSVSVTVNNATPPPSAIAYLQGNVGGYTAVTSINMAFPSANTAGNLIVVTARTSSQNRTWTLSDTRGNTYYLARQFNSTDEPNADLRVYYAYNITGGANTVTLSISGTATRMGVTVREYSGFSTANPLDRSAAASGSSAFLNSGTVTTTAANELIIGFGTTSNTATFTAGSGFANLLQNFAGRLASQDRIVSSAGTFNSTMSISPAFGWSSMVVTFK